MVVFRQQTTDKPVALKLQNGSHSLALSQSAEGRFQFFQRDALAHHAFEPHASGLNALENLGHIRMEV